MEEAALGWLGWSEEQTLYSDINAIMVGFSGRVKMVQAMQGIDPFSDGSETPKLKGPKARHIPPPDKLRPLTPEIFDAMFPGRVADGGKRVKGRRRR